MGSGVDGDGMGWDGLEGGMEGWKEGRRVRQQDGRMEGWKMMEGWMCGCADVSGCGFENE